MQVLSEPVTGASEEVPAAASKFPPGQKLINFSRNVGTFKAKHVKCLFFAAEACLCPCLLPRL